MRKGWYLNHNEFREMSGCSRHLVPIRAGEKGAFARRGGGEGGREGCGRSPTCHRPAPAAVPPVGCRDGGGAPGPAAAEPRGAAAPRPRRGAPRPRMPQPGAAGRRAPAAFISIIFFIIFYLGEEGGSFLCDEGCAAIAA